MRRCLRAAYRDNCRQIADRVYKFKDLISSKFNSPLLLLAILFMVFFDSAAQGPPGFGRVFVMTLVTIWFVELLVIQEWN